VTELVATSQSQPQTWKYTVHPPTGDWQSPDYDDSNWQSGPGGFGTEGTPGTTVRTVWDKADIWIRRSFDLTNVPTQGDICLTIHHDENAEVYINGQLVQELKGYTTGYKTFPLMPRAIKALKSGSNSIAIHCHQTGGGQYIDAGLSIMIDR
jgi:hypothetical protein